MKEIFIDTLFDSLKLLPFLFVVFLIIELIEHKLSNASRKKIEKAGKAGPFFGSIIGAFPQCGFCVAATNLYATRIISLGTLISVYLSTSDEMLPIMLSRGTDALVIFKIIIIKIIIGFIAGFVIDFVLRRKKTINIGNFCEENHCKCEEGIIKACIKHTFNILLFITIVSFILHVVLHYFGEENIKSLLLTNSIFSPFITSLIGLIPNCGASVIITELYLNNVISFASTISGLLTGCGVGLLVLFKSNKNLKENINILLMLYFIGSFSGLIIEGICALFHL
ncbi:MAG: putative manganese transporter [Bacilli bacterium]